MSKLKKVKSALINQAYLDPAQFEFENIKYGMRIKHKATGASIETYEKSVIIMGVWLRSWAKNNEIKELDLDSGEWTKVWSRLKYETKEI